MPFTPEVLTLKAQVLVAGVADTNATVVWTCGGINSCSNVFATVGNAATFNSTGITAAPFTSQICASYTYNNEPNPTQSCLSVTDVGNPPLTNLSGQWIFTIGNGSITLTADLTQTTTATGVVLASNGLVTIGCYGGGNTWDGCISGSNVFLNPPPLHCEAATDVGLTGTFFSTSILINLNCNSYPYVSWDGSLNIVGTPPTSLSTASGMTFDGWTGVQTSD